MKIWHCKKYFNLERGELRDPLSGDHKLDFCTFVSVVPGRERLVDPTDELHVLHQIVKSDEESVIDVVPFVKHLSQRHQVLLHPIRQLIRLQMSDDICEG